MLPCSLIVRAHHRPASAPPHLRVLSDLCVEIPPSRGSRYRTSSKFPRNLAKKAPFKSALYPLFQVPHPLSPLFATLTEAAASTPTIPILELIPPPRIRLSFQSVAQCPFCNPFVLMVFHLMGGVCPPPSRLRRANLRTFHVLPGYPPCFHTLAHSFAHCKSSTLFFSSDSALFAKNLSSPKTSLTFRP
jgi:hypothetical protein